MRRLLWWGLCSAACLDYRVVDWLMVRTGLVLPPVGIVNGVIKSYLVRVP
ncbi:MAG TPA: hypothetical protein VGV12_16285 [Gemmatimonadales bacterium]|nr:hypothetical protein [Gemmatimonadales bacterium]